MAIFSAFIKSPPPTPIVRSVPNGGLGGFVQLKGKGKTSPKTEGGKSEAEKPTTDATTRSRKQPPPPIRVNSVDVGHAPIQSAPIRQKDDRTSPAALWKISHPPLKTATGTAFVVTEVELQDPRGLVSGLLTNKTNDQVAHCDEKLDDSSDSETEGGTLQKFPSPVELPGSLLLPDRGFGSGNGTTSPSNATNRPRAYSERPAASSSRRRSQVIDTATKGIDPMKAVLRGAKLAHQPASSDSSAVSTEVNTPVQNKTTTTEPLPYPNVNTLSAENLIKVMSKMKAKKLATDWLPAMEKEIGKYKGLLHMYSNRTEVNGRHISSIAQDLRNLLKTMKESAVSACKLFEKAQADIDIQKRTDLEKLQQTEENLQEALLSCGSKTGEIDIRAPEFQHLKHILYHVVATLGGCIRNNLAYRLYHSPEGLSEEVVKILQAYKQWDDHTLKVFPSLVPAELYENAHKESTDLKYQIVEYKELVQEQQKEISQNADKCDHMKTQVDICTRELGSQRAQVRDLEEENAILRKEIQQLRKQMSRQSADPIFAESLLDDAEADDSHDRIDEQDAIIEELLKQVSENGGEHTQSHHSPTRGNGHAGLDSAKHYDDSDQVSTGSAEKRFLGSRTLSKAIDPISRSMQNRRSSLLDDNSTSFASQSSFQDQPPPKPRRRQSLLHPFRQDDRDPAPRNIVDNSDTQQSSKKKINVAPYPRESIMGIETLRRLKAASQQKTQPSESATKTSTSASKSEQQASAEKQNQGPKYKKLAPSPIHSRPSQRMSVSAFPSIDSRLNSAPSTPIKTHVPGPVRHGRTIVQGLRNEQLPLRLLLDKMTMADNEKRQSLSQISERTEDSPSGRVSKRFGTIKMKDHGHDRTVSVA